MSNFNTRTGKASTKTVTFRITTEEFEALQLTAKLNGTNAITATAREATLDVIKNTLPTNTLTRLGL